MKVGIQGSSGKVPALTAAKSPRMDTSKRVRTIVSHYTHNPSSEVAELKAKCQKRFRHPDFFHRGKQKRSFPRCSPGSPLPSLSPRTLSGSLMGESEELGAGKRGGNSQ